MPELPEVETVRRSLEPHLVGKVIREVVVREARLREPIDTAALCRLCVGQRVIRIRRRAKYLLCDLQGPRGDVVMLAHLGMTGRLFLCSTHATLNKHDHVRWQLSAERELRFCDPRRFGLVQAFPRLLEASHPRLVHLGVEPLSQRFDGAALYRLTRGSRRAIKSLLMDAGLLVGVGNIYASEALFRAGVHPSLPASRLSRRRAEGLAQAVKVTLEDAIEQGGTTIRDFANANGEAGYFAVRLNVYGRAGAPCPRCHRPIRRAVHSGRSSFYCPTCQLR